MKQLVGKRLVRMQGDERLSNDIIAGIEDRGSKVAIFHGNTCDVLWKVEASTLAEGCRIMIGETRMWLE